MSSNSSQQTADQQLPSDQPLGVTYDPTRGKWKARIYFAGQERYIGRYNTSRDAGLAYDQAARFINSLTQPSDSESTDAAEALSSNKGKRRQLNFPDQTPACPAVARRLTVICAAAGQHVLHTGRSTSPISEYAAAMSACGAEADVLVASHVAGETGPQQPAAAAQTDAAAAAAGPAVQPGSPFSRLAAAQPAAPAAAFVGQKHARSGRGSRNNPRKRPAVAANPAAPSQADDEDEASGAADAGVSAVMPGAANAGVLLQPAAEGPGAPSQTCSVMVHQQAHSQQQQQQRLCEEQHNQHQMLLQLQHQQPQDNAAANDAAALGDHRGVALTAAAAASAGPQTVLAGRPEQQQQQQQQQQPRVQQQPAHLPLSAFALPAVDALEGDEWDDLMRLVGVSQPPAVSTSADMQAVAASPQQQQQQQLGQQALLPAAVTVTLTPVDVLDGKEWDDLMELIGASAPPTPVASHQHQLPAGLAETGSAELQGSSGANTTTGTPEGSSTAGNGLWQLTQQQQQQRCNQPDSISRSHSCAVASVAREAAPQGVAPLLLAPNRAAMQRASSSTSTATGLGSSLLGAFAGTAPAGAGTGAGAAAFFGRYDDELQQQSSQPVSWMDTRLPPLLDNSALLPSWQAVAPQQPRARLQPPRLLPRAQCCGQSPMQQPELPPPAALLPVVMPHAPQGGRVVPAGPLAVHPDFNAPPGAFTAGVCASVVTHGAAAPDPANAAAAAAGVAVGSSGAELQPGLLACISTPAHTLSCSNRCLHYLTDLQLYTLQRPVNSSAIGAMLDWLQAAWSAEVMSQGPLPAGAAAVAAATAAAKAQRPCPSEPQLLALRLLDQLVLLSARMLVNCNAGIDEQRAFLLEMFSQLQQGLIELQHMVAGTAAGTPVQCRALLQVWVESKVLPGSSPAVAKAVQQLVQLL